MTSISLDFFAYQWSVDEDDESTIIRCYGYTKDNKNVYVRVDNFTPYCYVELPTEIEWTESRIEILKSKLSNLNRKIYQPIKKEFVQRRKLYYAWKEKRKKNKKNSLEYKDKLFPFLFFAFPSSSALRNFGYAMKKELEIPGIGRIKFNIHEGEAGISPILKLQALKKLPPAGMIQVKGIKIADCDKESSCDYEISCSYENLNPIDSTEIIEPKVLSFDIEANSTITSAMPDANRPNDKVFQIGLVSLINKKIKKLLFSLGNPDPKIVGKDVELRTFKNEADLLVAFRDYIHEENFNVIIGYNILGWDFEYMISRAKYTKCFSEFDTMGVIMGKHDPEVAPKFESKAYSAQKLVYLDSEGRLYLDLLPIIKRDSTKLTNYRLKTVTTYFGLPTKDPFTAQDIFRCYREFTPESLGGVGKYCVKDAYITLLLYQKLQTWYSMCEMSKTAHVPIFYLFSKGTQIQMFSQVMEYCMYNNYVIISNGYVMKEGDEYKGAIVLTPIPGKYKKVISFDFASLYPSIIMAHNIDYATLIPEGEMYIVDLHDNEEYLTKWNSFPCFVKMSSIDLFYGDKNIEEWADVRNKSELQTKVEYMKDKYPGKLVCIFKEKSIIPDSHCHVFCWADHESCSHDSNRKRLKNGDFSKAKVKVICGQRYYRFIKAEYGGKGVVPTLIESLISRRKTTRGDIKKNDSEIRNKLVSLIKNEEKVFIKEFEERDKKYFEDIEKDVQLIEKEEINVDEYISRIEFLYTENKILEERQKSYKICANSMYGAMGVKKGYLPLLPGASCTTYKGRCSIEFISTYIPEKYNGVTVYGDSVTGDTPVIVRYSNGLVNICMIEDLGDHWVKTYRDENKMIEKEHSACNGLEVWVDGKWSKIRRVIRHNTDKKIYRVLTHTGCVDVTEDHSLLTDEGKEIKPQECSTSTKLLHSFPTEFEEFVFLSKKDYVDDCNEIKLKCSECNEFKDLDKFYKNSIKKNRYEKNDICISCCRKRYDENRTICLIHVENKRGIEKVDSEEAYVWGLFMAEGSCGTYYCNSGNKHSWAINNQNYELLQKCQKILKEREGYDFKIIETMESSAVYKLVPMGCTKYMVLKYRELFYHGKERTGDNVDGDKSYKIVPHIILNYPKDIQKSFFEGWYEGDGKKKGYNLDKNFCFDCKGKIGSQGLFYLAKSIGYKNISINNLVSEKKEDIYRISGTNEKFRKDPDTVKKIHKFEKTYNKFVYDLETEEGAFHAGVGCLVLKNTDSSHIYFPHLKNNEEAVELAERITDEIQQFFPRPMKLEFEKIYERYIILTKKRYMCRVANKKGEIIDFIKKGVMLSRRDNCIYARIQYLKTAEYLLDDVDEKTILDDVTDGLNSLFQRKYSYKDFVITKSIGRDIYKMATLPAHVQLANKMKSRGIEVPTGARIEYIFTTMCLGEKKFAQGDKVEDIDYFSQWRQYLRIDYLYYLEKQLIKPLDELLFVGLGVVDFVKKQFALRMNKWLLMERIKELSYPKVEFEGEEVKEEKKENKNEVVKKETKKRVVKEIKKTASEVLKQINEEEEGNEYIKPVINKEEVNEKSATEKWKCFEEKEEKIEESIYGFKL